MYLVTVVGLGAAGSGALLLCDGTIAAIVLKFRGHCVVRSLSRTSPDLAELVEPLLIVRRALREQIVILHRRLLAIVRDDEVCRRLMTTPGVGQRHRLRLDLPLD
jgi:transposase